MSLSREDVRASIERAGEDHWSALVAHHEEAYPASRPTPGEVSRQEAERLNGAGYGDTARWELIDSRVRRNGGAVTIVHRLRDRQTDTSVETEPYSNYE